MDKLLVICDGISEEKKYTAYSGSAYADIATHRYLSNPKKAYTKVLEAQFPISKRRTLHIGPTVTLILSIHLSTSGNIPLTNGQFVVLYELLEQGEFLLGDYVTTLANHFATKVLSGQKDLLYSQLLINAIVPSIESFIHQDLAYLKELLPFLVIAVKLNSEIINEIETKLGKTEDAQLQAWSNIATPDLQSAYDPEDEMSAKIEYYKEALKLLPTTDAPTQNDINKAVKIIKDIRNEINKPAILLENGLQQKYISG